MKLSILWGGDVALRILNVCHSNPGTQ